MQAGGRNWRRTLRRGLDHLARRLGVLQWHERRMRQRPTRLMFHRVLPPAEGRDYPFPSLVVDTDAFAAMVDWLAKHTTVCTALAAGSATTPSDRPVVAITFDDGYEDNHRCAAPILEQAGLRGTFYVATGFVDQGLLWYDRAALLVRLAPTQALTDAAAAIGMAVPVHSTNSAADRVDAWVEGLKRVPTAARRRWLELVGAQVGAAAALPGQDRFAPMQPEQLRQLAARGHEIGSHTVQHEILPLLDDAALRHELTASRERLREWLGTDVPGFCYPNGSYDARVAAAVAAAGYAYAVTTCDPADAGLVDAFRLPRIDMNPSRFGAAADFDPVAFRAEISGLHARLR